MSASAQPPAPRSPANRRRVLAAIALLAAAVAAYHNSLHGAFVFDDIDSLLENPTLRSWWPPWSPFIPPHSSTDGGLTVSGRPVLNASFALNFAISGTDPWSYHLGNLLIHAAAGLVLFGLARRTFGLILARRGQPGAPADFLGFATALLWTVHPLQTESVTYVVQRAESLCGLFYLLTLYATSRSAEPGAGRRWPLVAVAACTLGMATKEVMVSAPLLALFYDRTFLADSFRSAWRQRWRLHLALFGPWVVLALLVASGGGNRGGSIGVGVEVSWWGYLLTQPVALLRYLALGCWPAPLVFEYGRFLVGRWTGVAPQALLLLGVVVAGAWGFVRRSPFGFAVAWGAAVLAPTTLVPGTTQLIVEHRVYLAAAPALAIGVFGLFAICGRRVWLPALIAGAAFIALTVDRNRDYASPVALWGDTVAKRPANLIARVQFGNALLAANRPAEALAQFEAMRQLDPDSAAAHSGLGTALLALQRPADAVAPLETAARLQPDLAVAHLNLGLALQRTGRPAEALVRLATAVRVQPEFAPAREAYAALLLQSGRPAEAQAQWERLVTDSPATHPLRIKLGDLLLQTNQPAAAAVHYERVLRDEPGHVLVHANLGSALALLQRFDEAFRHFETALRLQPGSAGVHNAYADALLRAGRNAPALDHASEALRLQPGFVEAHCNVGNALSQMGRAAEAIRAYTTALALRPDYAPAQQNLARLRGTP
ncbi:MAG: tetratricopeptide repeat protein [Verrucomicrobia bacterium]|nr:tetratricopeptide repeat protein [Verrucomicrobiota bacterium]